MGGTGPNNGQGVVFDLTPTLSVCKTAACSWGENVIFNFTGYSDGANPGYGDLIWDQQGNIYGTAQYRSQQDFGSVYELTPSNNGWEFSLLHSFGGLPDGQNPAGGVVFDSKGNLWGTTTSGGAYNQGTVFELTFVPGVGWQETIVYNFQQASDGGVSYAGLVIDSSGNLYGTTSAGGSGGGGTVFELSPSGKTYTFKVLYSFSGIAGCGPTAPLTQDAAGNFYSTTTCNGANRTGNVFRLTNTGNGWAYTSLYDFRYSDDGGHPAGNLTIDTDGTIYGTASAAGYFGGSCNVVGGCGTVWMIKP